MRTLKIANMTIGEGRPKICVPLVGRTENEIINEAKAVSRLVAEGDGDFPEMVEWRADLFEGIFQMTRICEVLSSLREVLKTLPILFTFRTVKEGGNTDISLEDYVQLNKSIAWLGLVDLIDVEILSGDTEVASIIGEAKKNRVAVIGSNHDFQKTPPKEEIIRRLRKSQDMGADIAKIAVMPNSPRDVLNLLDATLEMKEVHADIPIVTISMGEIGTASRFTGEIFGSDITFGAIEKTSAPGQIEAKALKEVLDIMHKVKGKDNADVNIDVNIEQ